MIPCEKCYMFFLFCFIIVNEILSLEIDFTVEVEPGRQDCFYQNFKKETGLEVEYQVIDGGDLDINFYVQAPNGQILLSENRKTEGTHKFDLKLIGDYKFCIDNSFSRLSKKLVFMELVSDSEEDTTNSFNNIEKAKLELSNLVDMTLEDFGIVLDNVKRNLEKTILTQNLLKVHEARDRNTQEDNFQRVNVFSCVGLFILFSVGLVQVLMIRSLFDDRSKVGKIMRAQT